MKLKTVIVDDDFLMVEMIKDLCNDFPIVEIVNTYTDPIKFKSELDSNAFDLVLLDIQMPGIDGIRLARLIKDKAIIFITGAFDKLIDALNTVNHIDVLTKPVKKELFSIALQKARLFIKDKQEKNIQEFKEFSLAKRQGKRIVKITDIVLVRTETADTHHKYLYLKSGECIIVTLCTMDEILKISPTLMQPNQSELVSKEIVNDIENDDVNIAKEFHKSLGVVCLKISRTYRKSFMENILGSATYPR